MGWTVATCGGIAAHHQAVALRPPPHAAARAGVDEADAAPWPTPRPGGRCRASSSCRPRRRCRPAAQERAEAATIVSSVGSPAGTITHTTRGAASRRPAPRAWATWVASLNDVVARRPRGRRSRRRSAMFPPIFPRPTMPSFMTHLPARTERTRPARMPRACRVRRSPAAWACFRWPKPKAAPGDGDLVGIVGDRPGRTRWLAGPPLWSWPVECRKRGPNPRLTSPRGGGRAARCEPRSSTSACGRRGRRRPGGRGGRPGAS